jgi:hypothetical protein
MTFTLTFQSLEEKMPQHEEKILFFNTSLGSFDSQSGEMKPGKVFYTWEQVDEDGLPEGNCCSYSPNDEPEEGWELYINLEYDDIAVSYGPLNNLDTHQTKNLYWCNLDEFWNTLPGPHDSGRNFEETWRT